MCGERSFIYGPVAAGLFGLPVTRAGRTCRRQFRPSGAGNAGWRFTSLGVFSASSAKGGERMKKNREYALPAPCRGCTRVADPCACESKDCPLWRRWFVRRWDSMRTYPRRQMENTVPVGISIGGRRYLHPDHLREYLSKDPCAGCGCPRDLCKTPCRAKSSWEEAIKEAKV